MKGQNVKSRIMQVDVGVLGKSAGVQIVTHNNCPPTPTVSTSTICNQWLSLVAPHQ